MSCYVLHEREELHGSVAVSYVMLQCNVHMKNSPVIETCVAVTLHVSWSSIPSDSPVPLNPPVCIPATNTRLSTFFSC